MEKTPISVITVNDITIANNIVSINLVRIECIRGQYLLASRSQALVIIMRIIADRAEEGKEEGVKLCCLTFFPPFSYNASVRNRTRRTAQRGIKMLFSLIGHHGTKRKKIIKILTLGMIAALLVLLGACRRETEWIDDGTPAELPLASQLTCELEPYYKTRATQAYGETVIEGLDGLQVSYDSTFYGFAAAIKRPYIRYGREFLEKKPQGDCPLLGGRCAVADLTGNGIGDIVQYSDGTLRLILLGAIVGGDTAILELPVETLSPGNDYLVRSVTELDPGGDVSPTAELCGAGDFNGDGFSDLLFADNGTLSVYFGTGSGFSGVAFKIDRLRRGNIRAGDVDGDGLSDIVVADGYTVFVYRNVTNAGNGLPAAGDMKFSMYSESEAGPKGGSIVDFLCADMNSDGRADAVFIDKNGSSYRVLTLFGRGDGTFGTAGDGSVPYFPDGANESDGGGETGGGKTIREYGAVFEGDRRGTEVIESFTSGDNRNLYSVYEFRDGAVPVVFAAGDISGTGAADLIGVVKRGGAEENVLLFSCDDAAYDYSMFGMKVGKEYRLYSGCRWSDANTNGDGDHIMLSASSDGIHWFRYLDAPMFLLGGETGAEGWWAGNTLEPEVLYVDGVYHMYWQCTGVTENGDYGDKIGYARSDDGVHWLRKTDEPAIVCSDPDVGFNHEEVIYVSDDPDGKPFWMYTGHFIKGNFSGYVLIRSAEPDRFLFSEREPTGGFSQIGNQIGYVDLSDGRRVFLRITFAEIDGGSGGKRYTAPTLQFSFDGRSFSGGNIVLAGVDQSDPRAASNRNSYFLGFVTENGTGRISPEPDGSYRIIYFATTSNSPGGPDVFMAEGGLGEVTLKLSEGR